MGLTFLLQLEGFCFLVTANNSTGNINCQEHGRRKERGWDLDVISVSLPPGVAF